MWKIFNLKKDKLASQIRRFSHHKTDRYCGLFVDPWYFHSQSAIITGGQHSHYVFPTEADP